MPSVRDKACQYSAQRQHTFQYSKLLRNANTFIKWTYSPRRLDFFLKNRLGDREPDMPKAGEEKVFNRNQKPSTGSVKHYTSESSVRKPTSSPSRSSRDAEESGQDRRGSPASDKRGSKPTQIANECTKILNVPLPVGQGRQAADTTNVKRTASSAAYLDYQLNQELRRRKKQIVDTLMAVILECLDKKLEALEEACDGGCSPSHASSSGFRTGNQKSQLAGQKRQLHRDDQDDNDNDDDSGGRENRNNKRAKIVSEENRLKYACPYYKFDPERFKSHRTCCGPGWSEVHRVKEHLNRSHSLPKHQCNRCCGRFKEEEELKAHQRESTPCTVKDPAEIHRNFGDGFDQEQQKKLLKRTKKTSAEKWKEWYCILFDKELDSTDIPSPYHDIPSGHRQRSNSSTEDNFQNFREYYREKITPMIQHTVEDEVEKAMLDVEDRVKSNVRDRMKGLPAMLHRLLQSIPPPGGDLEGDFIDTTAPDNFNPDDLFAELNFEEADGFDFGDMSVPQACPDSSDTSGSSSFSDSCRLNPGSDTSVDEENSYKAYDLKPAGMVAQQVPGLLDPYTAGGYY
ncbi:Fc.00g023910.m01.CDS01 [Cosmosporella sp. VM-42]